MVCCSVCGTSMTKKNVKDGITWHKFPRNEVRKVTWLKKMEMPKYWSPTPSSRLCSKHFIDDCFDRTSSAVVRLLPTAVPTIQINRSKYARNSNKEASIQETLQVLLTPASTSRESDILPIASTSDTPTESTIESRSHSSATKFTIYQVNLISLSIIVFFTLLII